MKNWIGASLGCLILAALSGNSRAQGIDPDTIPEHVVANAPALGKVAARNLPQGFLITTVGKSKRIMPGTQLAVRRETIILATGYIEAFQEGEVSILALHNAIGIQGRPEILKPAIGDEVILFPPQHQ